MAATLLVLAFVLAAGVGPAPAAVEVVATTSRNQVAVGERFTLEVDVKGTQSASRPDIGDLEGFHASYLGTTTHFTSTNGVVSSSVTYRYALTATRPGRFKLGPFSVRVAAATYQSDPVVVQVGGTGAAAGGGGRPKASSELRLSLEPAKTDVYLGERVPVTVTLAVGSRRVDRVDKVEYPKVLGDGFQIDPFVKPSRSSQIIDGQRFSVLAFRSTVTPLQAGEVALGPATLDATVLDSGGDQRGDPFDMDFGFGFRFGRRRKLTLRSEAIRLTVKPLPRVGRPDDFSGAIGRFDFELNATPTEVAAGDPITVRMQVRGVGNLAGLESPQVPPGEHFRTYEPLPVEEDRAPGRYTVEQVVIPKHAGIGELPAVRFTFFDPEVGAYRTIARGPIAIAVSAAGTGGRAGRPAVVSETAEGTTVDVYEELGRDIVYIKDYPGRLRRSGERFYLDTWFASSFAIAPLGVGLAMLYARRRERLAADPRIGRFRSAGRRARRALAAIERDGADGAAFYDHLATTMREYLSAKLDLPPGALDGQRVKSVLADGAGTDRAGEKVERFFDLIERARYAGEAVAGQQRREALALAGDIVRALERERSLALRFAPGVLALAVVASASWVGAQDDFHTRFFRGNAAYADGSFVEAIDAYEGVVTAGRESGPLYFNLGNAYFRAGEPGRAILNYERALRMMPRDPDVRANLAYARETLELVPSVRPLWRRLAFPLAHRATGGELAAATVVLWWGFWSILAGRSLVPRLRAGFGQWAWLAGVLTAFVGASFVMRLATVELASTGVIVAGADAPVRYEPSAGGVEYFKARPGSLVEVTEKRPHWLQIERGDGLRGWIARDAVALL